MWIHAWYDDSSSSTTCPRQLSHTRIFEERLAKLDLHQGFVKGVCWDPVGEFLATASDDRSVNIWRTTDWGLEACVTKPFEHSPGSTFFRRLRCAQLKLDVARETEPSVVGLQTALTSQLQMQQITTAMFSQQQSSLVPPGLQR